jgi:hypothetical protein
MTEKKTSEAQLRAAQKYKREKVKRFTVEFSPAESDLWDRVSGQPNKQGYIKSLIRADMERQKHTPDFTRLHTYLTDHEDTDTALMHNAGMDTYPSIIIEEFKK